MQHCNVKDVHEHFNCMLELCHYVTGQLRKHESAVKLSIEGRACMYFYALPLTKSIFILTERNLSLNDTGSLQWYKEVNSELNKFKCKFL